MPLYLLRLVLQLQLLPLPLPRLPLLLLLHATAGLKKRRADNTIGGFARVGVYEC